MNKLIVFLEDFIELDSSEKTSLTQNSTLKKISRKELFLRQGEKCNKIAFVEKGGFRMFYTTADGSESNTEFVLSSGFITDFSNFLKGNNSNVSIAALENSEIRVIKIHQLAPSLIKKLAHFGKSYVQNFCLPTLLDYQIIISEKPELRYQMLLEKYPEYIQKIPQKHIATYLRIRPETLSRIRRRILDLNQL